MPYFSSIVKAARASDGKKSLDELLSTQKVCINATCLGTTAAGYLAAQGDIESVKALISRGAVILPIVQGLAYAPALSGDKYLRNLNYAKALGKKYGIHSGVIIKSMAEGRHDDTLSPEEKKDDHYQQGKTLGTLLKCFDEFSPDKLPQMVNLANRTVGITSTFQSSQDIPHESIINLLNIAMRYEEDDILDYLLENEFISNDDYLSAAMKEKSICKIKSLFLAIEDMTEITQQYKMKIHRALIFIGFSRGHWKDTEELYNKYKSGVDLYPLEQLSRVAFVMGNLEIVKYLYETFGALPDTTRKYPDFDHHFQLTYPNNKSFSHLIIHINNKEFREKLLINYGYFKMQKECNIDELHQKLETSFLNHFSTTLAMFKILPMYHLYKNAYRDSSECCDEIDAIEELKVRYDLNNKMLFSWADPTIQLAILQGIQLVLRGTVSFDIYGYILTYLTPINSQESYSLLNKMFFQQNKVLISQLLSKTMEKTPFYKMGNLEYTHCYYALEKIKTTKNIKDLHQIISCALKETKSSEEKTPEFKKIMLHSYHERLGNKYKQQSIFHSNRNLDEPLNRGLSQIRKI